MKKIQQWVFSLLLLVFLPCTVIALLIFQSSAQWKGELAELAAQRAKLQSVVDFGNQKPAAQTDNKVEIEKHYVGVEDTPSLRAELQAKTKDMAAQRGLQVSQAQEEASVDVSDALKKVRVQLDINGVWINTIQFLQDIELQERWLFVESISLYSSEVEGMPAPNEPSIQMRIVVSGLVPSKTTTQ
jgi:Type II secretion system (T2SS), protein M subtype b